MSHHILTGRRIIITGGASGMGEALVRAFPGLGATVVSIDLSESAGTRVAAEAGARGFLAADVADERSIQNAIDEAVHRLGGLDVLIHAAGVATGGAAATTTLDVWNRVMAINATGTFLVNRAVFPHLQERGGTILNFASAAGVRGHPTKAAYAA